MKKAPIKLLLIEDSPSDAELFSALLGQVAELSFDIAHSTELDGGMKKIDDSKVDVVILDLGLPDSFGIQTYDRLRAHSPALPIIIISGNEDREMIAEAMNKGADNYLIKDAFDGNRVAVAILAAMRAKPNDPKTA
jgi:DNA-binding NarL/FixJ family response regulator